MKVNEKMIGTERCVLKRKDESKVVIERKDLGEQYTYIVKLPIDKLKISRYDKVIDLEHTLIFLTEAVLFEDGVILSLIFTTNYAIEKVLFFDEYEEIREMSIPKICEPEEDVVTLDTIIEINGIKEIITDPDMFLDMVYDGVITGDVKYFDKYDVRVPKFKVLKGGLSCDNKVKKIGKNVAKKDKN